MKRNQLFLYIFAVISLSAMAKCANVVNDFGSGYISPVTNQLDGRAVEANWIWDAGESNPQNYYLYIRKVFTLDSAAEEAWAYISASSFAEVYINGKLVERVPVKSDPEYQVYDNFDLTSYFVKGQNTIAAIVYNYGVGMHHNINARGGFFFQGQVKDTDGNIIKLNSDKGWRVCKAEAWDSSTKQRHVNHLIGFREKYDAAKALEGWRKYSFDDSGWEAATEIGIPPVDPWNGIVVVRRPFLRREMIEPVASWESNGKQVYDFGKVYSASPVFVIDADAAGVQIDIGTAERLDAERLPMSTLELNYTDTYITAEGRQTWKPMTWRSFRYLAIGKKEQVGVESVDAEFRSYPVEYAGSFTCSDENLNRYWKIGRWTMQICSQDTLMDTPWREQTQYIAGDSRYDMHYSNYAFGPEAAYLFKYNILSGAFSQRWKEEGSIRSRYPTDWLLGPATSTYIPDYQLEWVMMIHEYFMYYADERLVSEMYPHVKKLMAYFENYISKEHNLLGQVPGWVVLDHPDTFPMDVGGENTAMNCLYYGALNSAAWLAENVMADNEQAGKWQQKAASIKGAVNEYLFAVDSGVYKDGFESSRLTQQTQVYALKYGLAAEGKKARIIEFIKSKGRSCEQSFSYWLLNSMFAEGQGQWALDYIRQYWGDQTRDKDFNGAWHEGWDCKWGSTSHAWCAGPTALLPGKVLGVEPVLPGWKKFSIKPELCDLEWAKCVVPTCEGNITVRFVKVYKSSECTGMTIYTDIPANTVAEIHVPIGEAGDFAVGVNDKLVWKDGKFMDSDGKISLISKEAKSVVLEFRPGSYIISAVKGE